MIQVHYYQRIIFTNLVLIENMEIRINSFNSFDTSFLFPWYKRMKNKIASSGYDIVKIWYTS